MAMSDERRVQNGYSGDNDYSAHDRYETSRRSNNTKGRAFNINVHVNGNTNDAGRKILVKTDKMGTFDHLLDHLTDAINPTFGSIRRLYTSRGRHKITSVEDLQKDETYVGVNYGAYKKHNYKTIEDPRKRFLRHKGQYDKNKYVTPVVHNHHYQNQPGKAGYQAKLYTGLRLRVHINGEYERGAHVVKIEPQDIGNMQKICRTIEEYLGIPPILHMYKIEGNNDYSEVATAEELRKDDRVLVLTNHAASRKIIQANYHTDGLHQIRSPRAHHTYKDTFPSPTDPRYALNRHQRPLPSIGSSSKQSDAVSPFSNPPSQGGRKQNNRGGNRKTKEVNYDRDQGGVYKAKNGNTHGAREVNESKETRTELPVDQREAEEVEEEHFRNKEETTPIPPGTELNKQPSKEQKQNGEAHKGQTSHEVNKNKQNKNKGPKKNDKKSETKQIPELPPKVDDDSNNDKNNDQTVKKDEKGEVDSLRDTDNKSPEVKEGFVDEKVEKFEEMSREKTPDDLKSNDVVLSNPPLSTTPPERKTDSSKIKDRNMDEQADNSHRIDEFEDESFNQTYDQNASARNNTQRSSTPTSRGETRRSLDPASRGEVRQSPAPPSRGEARREQERKEHEAATKIQAGARGRKVRKEYNARKEGAKREQEMNERRLEEEKQALREEEEQLRQRQQAEQQQAKSMNEDEAASKIQASFKGYKTRKDIGIKKQQVRSNAIDQDKAATKIQSGFRGNKTRKEFANKKKLDKEKIVTDVNANEKQNSADYAATKIQSSYKGYKTRKELKDRKSKSNDIQKSAVDEAKAATAIQAGYKGYKTRKDYASKKKSKVEVKASDKEAENAAASKIQANYKGHRTRKEYSQKKQATKAKQVKTMEEQEAATKIQASFKGYKSRREFEEKKKRAQLPDEPSPKPDDSIDKAATKIQSGYRGYKTRKEFKAKVIDQDVYESDGEQLPESNTSRSSLRKGQFIEDSKGVMASHIQAAFRGFHARKCLIENQKEYRTEMANEKIVAAYKGYLARKPCKDDDEKLEDLARENAVLQVQTHSITHKNRDNDQEHEKLNLINKIHAAFRGYISRNLYRKKAMAYDRVVSVEGSGYYATLIQALCRGFITRCTVKVRREVSMQGPSKSNLGSGRKKKGDVSYWEDSKVKMFSDKTLRLAASNIQSACLMFSVRQSHRRWKARQSKLEVNRDKSDSLQSDRENAAIKIQSWYRGYLVRKRTLCEDSKNVVEGERIVTELSDVESLNEMLIDGEVIVSNSRPSTSKDRYKSKESVSNRPKTGHSGRRSGSSNRMVKEERSNSGVNRERVENITEVKEVVNTLNESVQHLRESPIVLSPIERTSSANSGTPSRPQSRKRDSSGRMKSARSRKSKHTSSPLPKTNIDDENNLKSPTFGSDTIVPLTDHSVRTSTQISETAKSLKSGTSLGLSEVDKENTQESMDTVNSSEKAQSSSGEIEKEGDSVREVEDDAGELSSIEKNINAICKLQAAFRAYRTRKEVSEFLSGGGDLMDIQKIDRAVSALRKDFKLRSSKHRRLGSFQFGSGKKEKWGSGLGKNWWEADEMDGVVRDEAANVIQSAYRGYHYRQIQAFNVTAMLNKTLENSEVESSKPVESKSIELMADDKKDAENVLDVSVVESDGGESLNRTVSEKDEQVSSVDTTKAGMKIEAAYRGFVTRTTEKKRVQAISEKKIATAKIQAAFQGYKTRKTKTQILAETKEKDQSHREHANLKIEAAYRGYRTRTTEKHRKEKLKLEERNTNANAKIQAAFRGFQVRRQNEHNRKLTSQQSTKSIKSVRSGFHVELQSSVINDRATKLQAAFAGYQTRKVFISLTKELLVDKDTIADNGAHVQPLERMGSLSETDDFKLRHKSIAKMHAALEAHRLSVENIPETDKLELNQQESKTGTKMSVPKAKKNMPIQLPLIVASVTNGGSFRPKSSTLLGGRTNLTIDKSKSKTQPDLLDNNATPRHGDLKGIEVYIKKKAALTVIQSSGKGFLLRRTFRSRSKNITDQAKGIKAKQDIQVKSGKVNFKATEEEEEENWAKEEHTEMVRVRTASVKMEGERRKLIAERLILQQAEEQRSASVASVKERAEKLKAEKGLSRKIKSPSRMTPILSDRSNNVNDVTVREDQSAVKIQKMYRGYRVRKSTKSKEVLQKEYDVWKKKRIEAAVTIQRTWRGYKARQELKEKENEQNVVTDDDSIKFESPVLLVINIGRTKSEIERAERRYQNATMLQMVYRASKIRRKVMVNMAKRRVDKNKSAAKIQALVRGFLTRRKIKGRERCARIQVVFKAYMNRERMNERKEMKKIKEQNIAASSIQASFLARKKRIENNKLKKERRIILEKKKASTCIQSMYKAYIARKAFCTRKKEMQDAAASKIQACVKGYRERKKFQARKKAATLIESTYRSYKRRQDLKMFKENLKQKHLAARNMQSAFRGYMRRQEYKQYKDKVAREKAAVTRIQCIFKGRRTRLEHKNRSSAVLKIQCVYRGHKARNIARRERHIREVNQHAKYVIDILFDRAFDYLTRRADSAEHIQATIKGHDTRTRKSEEDERKMKAQKKAVSAVQAVVRAVQGRKRLEMKSANKKHDIATKIQAVVRAKQARLRFDKQKQFELETASTIKIQSLFRGFIARKEFDRERAIIAKLSPPMISARTRSGRLLELSMDEVLMTNARAIIVFHRKATELQDAFRGYKTRREMMSRIHRKERITKNTPRRINSEIFTSKEDLAAVTIQKVVRGYSDRKMYKFLVSNRRKILDIAATNVQASVKGSRVRGVELERQKRLRWERKSAVGRRKGKAADIIQTAYRSMTRRLDKMAMRAEM